MNRRQRVPAPVMKRELRAAIRAYTRMLYGEKTTRGGGIEAYGQITPGDELRMFLPIAGRLFGRITPGVIRKVVEFAKKVGGHALREYLAANLTILKVQAERMQDVPVTRVRKHPPATWPRRKARLAHLAQSPWSDVRRKLETIVDAERNAGMSSFERFHRAVLGKRPDRVPFAPLMDYFYARVANFTVSEFVASPNRVLTKCVRATHDLFANYFDMVHLPMGRVYSFFQPVPVAHSGFYARLHIPQEVGQVLQFVEKGYVKLEDIPRLAKEGFASIWRKRPLGMIGETMLDFFGVGDFVHYWEQKRQVPLYTGSAIAAPLEALSYLLGINQWSRALIRRPEETWEACQALMPGLMGNDLLLKEFSGVQRAYICLERVSPQFISPKAFERLVWPQLREIVEHNVKLGYVNLFHMDTDWEPFLPYFAELPKRGWYIFHLENTDIERAQEIVGHLGAVMGNLDGNLLVFGSPRKVKERVTHLIDTVGADGGFILSAGCHLPPDTPPANVVAIIETLEERGWY